MYLIPTTLIKFRYFLVLPSLLQFYAIVFFILVPVATHSLHSMNKISFHDDGR